VEPPFAVILEARRTIRLRISFFSLRLGATTRDAGSYEAEATATPRKPLSSRPAFKAGRACYEPFPKRRCAYYQLHKATYDNAFGAHCSPRAEPSRPDEKREAVGIELCSGLIEHSREPFVRTKTPFSRRRATNEPPSPCSRSLRASDREFCAPALYKSQLRPDRQSFTTISRTPVKSQVGPRTFFRPGIRDRRLEGINIEYG